MLQILFHRFLFSLPLCVYQYIQDTFSFSLVFLFWFFFLISFFFFFKSRWNLFWYKECGRDSVYIFSSQMCSQLPNSIYWSESCSHCSGTPLYHKLSHIMCLALFLYYSFFFFWFWFFVCLFGHATQHVGSWFPEQGSDPCLLQCEHGDLTTRLPGESYFCTILFPCSIHHQHLKSASQLCQWVLPVDGRDGI